jgi:hypothetical protein
MAEAQANLPNGQTQAEKDKAAQDKLLADKAQAKKLD